MKRKRAVSLTLIAVLLLFLIWAVPDGEILPEKREAYESAMVDDAYSFLFED